MLKDFHLIHRRKPHAQPSVTGPVWETCLRSIQFASAKTSEPGVETYSEAAAYRFLLEVICGLHSPILGETEVFGQFKNFAREWAKAEPHRVTLIQRLFNEAKEIRSQHLSHLGTQSYGGWLKRNLTAKTAHVLGAGQLASEMMPYLLKAADRVVVHAREPDKVKFANVRVEALESYACDGGALIIAAPLTAKAIHQWLKVPPTEIFDLRADSATDRLQVPGARICVLHDVFSEIERTKARLTPIVARVKSEIQSRSERIATQIQVRPQGWDDICA